MLAQLQPLLELIYLNATKKISHLATGYKNIHIFFSNNNTIITEHKNVVMTLQNARRSPKKLIQTTTSIINSLAYNFQSMFTLNFQWNHRCSKSIQMYTANSRHSSMAPQNRTNYHYPKNIKPSVPCYSQRMLDQRSTSEILSSLHPLPVTNHPLNRTRPSLQEL